MCIKKLFKIFLIKSYYINETIIFLKIPFPKYLSIYMEIELDMISHVNKMEKKLLKEKAICDRMQTPVC